MPTTKPNNEYRLRQIRIAATNPTRPIRETIERAKQYVEDQVWLSPVELKVTIRQLAETLETMLATPPQVIQSAEQVASKSTQARTRLATSTAVKTSSSSEIAEAKRPKPAPAIPTHTGTVLGLKGREDYEAQLINSGTDQMTDQHGRSFNLKDYGYDGKEMYRLDLESVREI